MAKNNEGKCLDAVIRILERQFGATRKVISRDTPTSPGIELICEIAGRRFGLEHTLIEPFPNNQKDNIEFTRIFDDEFEAAVKDVLKPDSAYDIWVDVYSFSGMNGKRRSVTRQAIIDWVRSAAPRLPAPKAFRQTSICAQLPGSGVPVRLSCHHSKSLAGRILPGRIVPLALEELRRERLLKSLKDKGPKLFAVKGKGTETRTVLVLENQDISLTNEGELQALLEDLGRKFTPMPDDVFVIGTYTARRYYVVQLRKNGEPSFVFGAPGGDWSFDASMLHEV
jgi:hypothetical protein